MCGECLGGVFVCVVCVGYCVYVWCVYEWYVCVCAVCVGWCMCVVCVCV